MKFGKITIALVALTVLMSGFGGIAMADHNDGENVDDVIHVNPEDATADDTYETIQEAVDSANASYHIEIEPGEYQENVTVEVENLSFTSSVEGENVTVDGELNGEDAEVENVELSDDVTFNSVNLYESEDDSDEGSGGAAIGDDSVNLVDDEMFGIPYIVWIIAVAVVGFWGYKEYGKDD